MYVLRYTAVGDANLFGLGVVVLCVGHGDAAHVKALFGTDCLWFVPGTVDPDD